MSECRSIASPLVSIGYQCESDREREREREKTWPCVHTSSHRAALCRSLQANSHSVMEAPACRTWFLSFSLSHLSRPTARLFPSPLSSQLTSRPLSTPLTQPAEIIIIITIITRWRRRFPPVSSANSSAPDSSRHKKCQPASTTLRPFQESCFPQHGAEGICVWAFLNYEILITRGCNTVKKKGEISLLPGAAQDVSKLWRKTMNCFFFPLIFSQQKAGRKSNTIISSKTLCCLFKCTST